MTRNDLSNLKMPLYIKKYAILLLFPFLYHLIIADSSLYAQNLIQKPQITYKNRLLTISIRDTDIINILSRLSDKTNISIIYPESLKKKVTINKNGVSLEKALKSLLKGLNYVIIYSAKNKNKNMISEVRVFEISKKSKLSERQEKRITNRIRSYERQIKNLKNRMSKVDENSRQGKSYLNRIRRYEKNILSLEKQLY